MKRFLTTIALVLLVVTAFAKPYKVTASKLNVRSTPDASGTVVGSLTQNTQVEVNRISGGWAEITFKGKKAYISAQYIAPVTGSSSNSSSNKNTNAQSSSNKKGSTPPPNPHKKGNTPPPNPHKKGNTANTNGKKGGSGVTIVVDNSIEQPRLEGFHATYDMRYAAYSGSFRFGETGNFVPKNMNANKPMLNGLTSGFGFEYNYTVHKTSAANIMVGGRTGFSYDYSGSSSFSGQLNGNTIKGRTSYHSITFPLQPQVSFEWMAGRMNMGVGIFTGPVFQAYFMRNLWKFESGDGSMNMGVENYVTGHILGVGGSQSIEDERRSGSFNCMWDTGFFLQMGTFRIFFSTAWGMHNFIWTRGGNGVQPVAAHLNRPVAVGFQTLIDRKSKKRK